jgi:hypothetical protein
MIKYRAELKCYLCGRTAGELETMVGDGPSAPRFQPMPGMESLVGKSMREARCPLCGGTLFIEDVERVYFLTEQRFAPEKRGRKPRPRPETVAS